MLGEIFTILHREENMMPEQYLGKTKIGIGGCALFLKGGAEKDGDGSE